MKRTLIVVLLVLVITASTCYIYISASRIAKHSCCGPVEKFQAYVKPAKPTGNEAAISAGSGEGSGAGVSASMKSVQTESAVCPVMGTRISDVSQAAEKGVYRSKTYYFCCKGCKSKLDKNPDKYLKQLPMN